ncbi:hypothetical protein [Nocardiopsis dassonvillei]|uniref:hypothetical protein n=1 Tax=Nocardiopsis dassonvillei TaxID=2014 RepID=UPI00362CA63E
MIAVLLGLAVLALVLTVGAVLLAIIGRDLVHADHDLPEPARRAGPLLASR